MIVTRLAKIETYFFFFKMFEYNFDEKRFTCSSKKQYVENSETHAVTNIVLDPLNENVIMLHNDAFLYVLLKRKVSEKL